MRAVAQGIAAGLGAIIPVLTFPIDAIWDSVILVIIVVLGSWFLGLMLAGWIGGIGD